MSAGRNGPEVVPCFWQQGGPLKLASDIREHSVIICKATYATGAERPGSHGGPFGAGAFTIARDVLSRESREASGSNKRETDEKAFAVLLRLKISPPELEQVRLGPLAGIAFDRRRFPSGRARGDHQPANRARVLGGLSWSCHPEAPRGKLCPSGHRDDGRGCLEPASVRRSVSRRGPRRRRRRRRCRWFQRLWVGGGGGPRRFARYPRRPAARRSPKPRRSWPSRGQRRQRG
jgi:hypothetical protein